MLKCSPNKETECQEQCLINRKKCKTAKVSKRFTISAKTAEYCTFDQHFCIFNKRML